MSILDKVNGKKKNNFGKLIFFKVVIFVPFEIVCNVTKSIESTYCFVFFCVCILIFDVNQ